MSENGSEGGKEEKSSKLLEFDDEDVNFDSAVEESAEEKEDNENPKGKRKQESDVKDSPVEGLESKRSGGVFLKESSQENLETKKIEIEEPVNIFDENSIFVMAAVPKDVSVEIEKPFKAPVANRNHSSGMDLSSMLHVPCIRWRFKKDVEATEELFDSDGTPNIEGNARLVEWEDGSVTLYVGKTSYEGMTENERNAVLQRSERNDDVFQLLHNTKEKYLFKSTIHKRILNMGDKKQNTTMLTVVPPKETADRPFFKEK